MSEMDILKILSDPDAVHLNLLRGTLARPSVEQIIHLYGAETLRAALPAPPDPDLRVSELEATVLAMEAVIASQAALIEERYSDMHLVGFEDGVFTFKSPIIPLIAEAMAQTLRPDRASGPANYTETAITHAELGPMTLTLQRKTGKTPHELRREAETRADQAERRENALLASNQWERSALVELAGVKSRLRDALRRAEAEPDRAMELLSSVVREAGRL